jgi:hypothetical protein
MVSYACLQFELGCVVHQFCKVLIGGLVHILILPFHGHEILDLRFSLCNSITVEACRIFLISCAIF